MVAGYTPFEFHLDFKAEAAFNWGLNYPKHMFDILVSMKAMTEVMEEG